MEMTIIEIRQKIWILSQGNVRFIESCKILSKFTEDIEGYYRLLTMVKKMLENAGIEC